MAYPTARNKGPILEVLKKCINILNRKENSPINIVEIASGTGEHASFFATNLTNIKIQPTEPQETEISTILQWSNNLSNILPPLNLSVSEINSSILHEEMQNQNVDILICINMIHISPITSTYELFRTASNILKSDGITLLYGPYRVKGTMVESNHAFDQSLKSRNSEWGIRDLEEVETIAFNEGQFLLHSIEEMPANNLCLIFQK